MEVITVLKDSIIITKSKEQCCGCGTCFELCPKQAITMEIDEEGFLYPKINDALCIRCEICVKYCPFSKKV